MSEKSSKLLIASVRHMASLAYVEACRKEAVRAQQTLSHALHKLEQDENEHTRIALEENGKSTTEEL